MSTEELLEYLKKEVPTFTELEIVENGKAYHYTKHFDKIEKIGKFLGAEINSNLDKTQNSLISKPATNDPGVVFAYSNFSDAEEEGFDCDILEIEYNKAILANHSQENSLDSLTNLYLEKIGESENLNSENLKTLLILNTQIISYKKVES